MKIDLTGPQFDFVEAREQFPAFVGGFGSGKTYAATMRALACKLRHPRLSVAYYLPTYDLVRTIGFPRFAEVLENIGLPYKLNRTDATLDVLGAGQILFRTMDTPERSRASATTAVSGMRRLARVNGLHRELEPHGAAV